MARKKPLTSGEAKAEALSLSETKAELLKTIAGEEDFEKICEGFTSSEERQYHANRVEGMRNKVREIDERLQKLQAFIDAE